MWLAFSFWFLQVLQLRDFLESQKTHGLWTLERCRDYEKLWEFLSWTECSFHYDIAASPGSGMWRLNENCPHWLIYLHAKFSVNGLRRIRGIERYDLIEVGVVLLEEVCPWGWVLRFQKPTSGPMSLFLSFILVQDVKLWATSPAPCLPVSCRILHCDDNRLISKTESKPSELNEFFYFFLIFFL